MVAAKFNLLIEQGADFSREFTYTDETVDLTGFTARMKIRPTIASSTVIADLSMSNGLSISVPARSVSIDLAASTTAGYDFDTGVYDLELVSGVGSVTRLVEGSVTLAKEVTR